MALPDFVKKLLVFNELRWVEGNLILYNDAAVFMPAEILVMLQDRLVEELGNEKAGKIMCELGREQARVGVRWLKSRTKEEPKLEDFEKSKLFRVGNFIFEVEGWGKPSYNFVRSETGEKISVSTTVELKNSPLAKEQLKLHGTSKTPVCHLVCGMFEGATEEFFGMKAKVIETKCAAQEPASSACILKMEIEETKGAGR